MPRRPRRPFESHSDESGDSDDENYPGDNKKQHVVFDKELAEIDRRNNEIKKTFLFYQQSQKYNTYNIHVPNGRQLNTNVINAIWDPDKDFNEVVASCLEHNLKLTRGDTARLFDGELLNDEIINCALGQMQRNSKDCLILNTFFYRQLINEDGTFAYQNVKNWLSKSNINPFSYKRILVPIYTPGHWSCVMINTPGQYRDQDDLDNNIWYFCSLGGDGQRIMEHLRLWMVEEARRLNVTPEIVDEIKNIRKHNYYGQYKQLKGIIPIPQTNSTDCGVYLIQHVYHLVHGNRLNLLEKYVPYYRRMILTRLRLYTDKYSYEDSDDSENSANEHYEDGTNSSDEDDSAKDNVRDSAKDSVRDSANDNVRDSATVIANKPQTAIRPLYDSSDLLQLAKVNADENGLPGARARYLLSNTEVHGAEKALIVMMIDERKKILTAQTKKRLGPVNWSFLHTGTGIVYSMVEYDQMSRGKKGEKVRLIVTSSTESDGEAGVRFTGNITGGLMKILQSSVLWIGQECILSDTVFNKVDMKRIVNEWKGIDPTGCILKPRSYIDATDKMDRARETIKNMKEAGLNLIRLKKLDTHVPIDLAIPLFAQVNRYGIMNGKISNTLRVALKRLALFDETNTESKNTSTNPDGNRTGDLGLRRAALYPLSYRIINENRNPGGA
jgi:hypothetical protein